MDSPAQIMVSHESSIMASSATRGHGPWFWIVSALAAIFCVSLAIFLWLICQPLSLPKQQSLILITTPSKVTQTLNADTLAALPTTWQVALKTKTSWPVVLIAYEQQGEWHDMAYMPRWLKVAGLQETMHGFVKKISHDTTLPLESDTNRYLFILTSRLSHFTMDSLGTWNSSFPELGSVSFFTKNKQIITKLPFEQTPNNTEPIRLADISLNIVGTSTDAFLENLSIAGQPLQSIQNVSSVPLSQVNLQLGPNNETTQTTIVFKDTPVSAEISQILALLNIADEQEITLPDGSTYFDRVPLQVQGEFTTSTRWGTLHWSGRELSVGSLDQSPSPVKAACADTQALARLSSPIYQKILGLSSSISHLPALQLGVKDKHLILCLE